MRNQLVLKGIITLICTGNIIACSNKAPTQETDIVASRIEVKKALPVEKLTKNLISALEQSHKIFDETRNKIENQPFKASSVFKSVAKVLKSPTEFKHLRVLSNPTRIQRTDGTVIAELKLENSNDEKSNWSWSFPSAEFKDFEVGITAKILSYKISCNAVTEGKKLLELNCTNLSFNIAALEHVHFETFKFNRTADPAIIVAAQKFQNLTEAKAKLTVTVPLVGIIDYFEKEAPVAVVANQIQTNENQMQERTIKEDSELADRKPTLNKLDKPVNQQYDENGEPIEAVEKEKEAQPEQNIENPEIEKQAEVLSQT